MTTMEKYSESTWDEWNKNKYDLMSYVGDLKINPETFEIANDSIVYQYGFYND